MSCIPAPMVNHHNMWLSSRLQVADPNKKHHEDNFWLMEKELAEAFAHDGAWTLEKIQLHKENIDVIPSMYTEDAALLGEERIGRASVGCMPKVSYDNTREFLEKSGGSWKGFAEGSQKGS